MNAVNPLQRSLDDATLRAARKMIEDGVEFDATEQVLRDFFHTQLNVRWVIDQEGKFTLVYRGWKSQGRFVTFHEMLAALLGLLPTSPAERDDLFLRGGI